MNMGREVKYTARRDMEKCIFTTRRDLINPNVALRFVLESREELIVLTDDSILVTRTLRSHWK